MTALIYKIASTLFTLAIIGRVLFLAYRRSTTFLKRVVLILKKHRVSKLLEMSEGERNKLWFSEYQRKEREKKEIFEREHYTYKNTYVNLSTLSRDRKKLFCERWTDWKFNADNCELSSPGDYHAQCLKMFGEMAFARRFLM